MRLEKLLINLSHVRLNPMYSSCSEFGVLNVVPSVSAFDNGINPHIEFEEVGDVLLVLATGTSIGVEVRGLTEEVSTESFMRVVEDSVLVGAAESGGILDVEGNVPDELALSSLGTAGLLTLLVPDLAGLSGLSWLNSSDAE